MEGGGGRWWEVVGGGGRWREMTADEEQRRACRRAELLNCLTA